MQFKKDFAGNYWEIGTTLELLATTLSFQNKPISNVISTIKHIYIHIRYQ
jgi:hypothetical protein